jgi:omega-amidase
MQKQFKLAICQLKVIDNKNSNIKKAKEMIESSAKNSADIVILPEMFNCPYDNSKFREYAENKDQSKTLNAISKAAKKNNILIVAGSIPELDDKKLYNSCFLFDNFGKIIGKYRKMHLFDIDTPQLKFKESDVLSAGDKIGVFDINSMKIGIAICYDMRFPELIRLMALKGAQIIIVPGNFNMITGPAHWEVLIRSRSVDNQIFMAAASTARNKDLSYVSYGHSMITGPWGEILARADEKENIIYANIDMDEIEKVKKELPLLKNRRKDIYDTINKKK